MKFEGKTFYLYVSQKEVSVFPFGAALSPCPAVAMLSVLPPSHSSGCHCCDQHTSFCCRKRKLSSPTSPQRLKPASTSGSVA